MVRSLHWIFSVARELFDETAAPAWTSKLLSLETVIRDCEIVSTQRRVFEVGSCAYFRKTNAGILLYLSS